MHEAQSCVCTIPKKKEAPSSMQFAGLCSLLHIMLWKKQPPKMVTQWLTTNITNNISKNIKMMVKQEHPQKTKKVKPRKWTIDILSQYSNASAKYNNQNVRTNTEIYSLTQVWRVVVSIVFQHSNRPVSLISLDEKQWETHTSMKTQSAKVRSWHATPNFHICMIAYMRSAHVFHHVIHMFRVHTCVYACNSFLHWWLDFMTVQKIKSRKITKFSLPWASALPRWVVTCWFMRHPQCWKMYKSASHWDT